MTMISLAVVGWLALALVMAASLVRTTSNRRRRHRRRGLGRRNRHPGCLLRRCRHRPARTPSARGGHGRACGRSGLRGTSSRTVCCKATKMGATRLCASSGVPHFESRIFWFFQAQGLLSVLFSLPALVAMSSNRRELGVLDGVALVIWVVAVSGEALADRQLAAFRADPANRGRTCRQGPVEDVAPSELLLRVAALVELCRGGHRRRRLVDRCGRAAGHAGLHPLRHRHSADRGARPALPRRGLSGLPTHHLGVHPLVSEEGDRTDAE